MRNRQHKKKEKGKYNFSLRVRLTVMVCIDLVVSVMVAALISMLLRYLIPGDFNVPLWVELCIISIIIGGFITTFLSKWLFEPIKELCTAMEKVANGDFKVRIRTKSSSREIRNIYSGFNLMVQELDATEILQSDFVSNVSHEFKTPISAVEGYATLLQDCENLNDEQKTYVEKINFNTARLSTLVGNILLLSKIDNQHICTNKSVFRLDEQIRQSIVMLEPQWEKKNIDLDVDMVCAEYNGNEAILHHVWDNLISNAIKFSPDGGTIRISLVKDSENIVFTVEDEGPGISPDALKHIFDKFYQADSSHKQDGNGLGLALVKRILTVIGGDIRAENLEKRGCKFTVTLKG